MNDDGYNSPRREGFFLTEEADRNGRTAYNLRTQFSGSSSSDDSSEKDVDSCCRLIPANQKISVASNVDHESKLNAMRKHNTFRLRQQQIKTKLINDGNSPEISSLKNEIDWSADIERKVVDRSTDIKLHGNQITDFSNGRPSSSTPRKVDELDKKLSYVGDAIEEMAYNNDNQVDSKVSDDRSISYNNSCDTNDDESNSFESKKETNDRREDKAINNLKQHTISADNNYLSSCVIQDNGTNFRNLIQDSVRQQHPDCLETMHEIRHEFTGSEKRRRQKELNEKFCGEEMTEYIRCIPNVKKTQESWIKAKKAHALEAERQSALEIYRGSKIIAEKEAKILSMQESIAKLLLSKISGVKKTPRRRVESECRTNSDPSEESGVRDGEEYYSRSKSAGQGGESKINHKDHGIRSPGSEVVFRKDKRGAGTTPKGQGGQGSGIAGKDLDPRYRPSWISNQDARYDEQGSTYEEYGEEKGGESERELRSLRVRGGGSIGGRDRGTGVSSSAPDISSERLIDQRLDLGCGEDWLAAVIAQRKIETEKIKAADIARGKEKEKERNNNKSLFDDKKLLPKIEIETENKEKEKEKVKSKRNSKIEKDKDDRVENKTNKEHSLDSSKLGKNVLINIGLEVENKNLPPKKLLKKKKRRSRKDSRTKDSGTDNEEGGREGVGRGVGYSGSGCNVSFEHVCVAGDSSDNVDTNNTHNNNNNTHNNNNNTHNNNNNNNRMFNIADSPLSQSRVSYQEFLTNISTKASMSPHNPKIDDFTNSKNDGLITDSEVYGNIRVNEQFENKQKDCEEFVINHIRSNNGDGDFVSNGNGINYNIKSNLSISDRNVSYINTTNTTTTTTTSSSSSNIYHNQDPYPSTFRSAGGEVSLTQVLADLDRTRQLTRRGTKLTSSLTLSSAASSSLSPSSYTPHIAPSSSSSSHQPSSTTSPSFTSSTISSYASPTNASTALSPPPFSFDPMSSTSEKGRFKVQDPRNFDAESIRCTSDPNNPSVTLVTGKRRVRSRYPVTEGETNESGGRSAELVAVLFERRWFDEGQAMAWWGENSSRVTTKS